MENGVRDYFAFAKYLRDYYEYHDSTEDGDVYKCNETSVVHTELEIYLEWLNICYKKESLPTSVKDPINQKQ